MGEDVAGSILAMERAALDRWGRGDPDGFLEISDPDVVYFDPFQPRRIDGLAALRGLVQVHGDIAVLTFRFDSSGNESEMHWNTTEVYRRSAVGWRIIHSHWSLTQPRLAG